MTNTCIPPTLVCRITAASCRHCNRSLTSAEQANLKNACQTHKTHLDFLTFQALILQPVEYCGLQLNIELPWLAQRPAQLHGGLLRVPSIPVKLLCILCRTQISARKPRQARNFASRHAGHLHHLRLHAVSHNLSGQVLTHGFTVCGLHSHPQPGLPDNCAAFPGSDQPLLLLQLWSYLRCLITGIQCLWPGHEGLFLDEHFNPAQVVRQHHAHLDALHLHLRVTDPVEYAGLHLRCLARPFLSCLRREVLNIDCMVFQVACERCHSALTPWTRTAFQECLQRHSTHLQSVKMKALVRHDNGTLLESTFWLEEADNRGLEALESLFLQTATSTG